MSLRATIQEIAIRFLGIWFFESEWERIEERPNYEIIFIDRRDRIEVDNIGGARGEELEIPTKGRLNMNGKGEDGSVKDDVEYSGHEYECINNRDWTFLYWEDENGDRYYPGDKINVVEDNIMTAVWKNTTDYKVEFRYIDKKGVKQSKFLDRTFKVGEFYKGLDIPEDLGLEENEKFRGWKHKREGSLIGAGEEREVYIYEVNPIVYEAILDKEDREIYRVRFLDKFGRNNLDDRMMLAGTELTIPGADCLECMQGTIAYDFNNWSMDKEPGADLLSSRNMILARRADTRTFKPGDSMIVNRDMDFQAQWIEKKFYNVIFIDKEGKNKIGNIKLYEDQRLLIPNPKIKDFKDGDYKYNFRHFEALKDNKYDIGNRAYLRDRFEIGDARSKDVELYLIWDKERIGGGSSGGGGGSSGGGGGSSGGGGGSSKPDEKPGISDKDKEDMLDDYKNGDKSKRDELLGEIIEEKVDYSLEKEDHFSYIKGYPDDSVRPSGNITREEVAMVIFRIADAEFREDIRTKKHNFSDVRSGKWSEEAIASLEALDIIDGYPDGEFKPAENITRAEVAKIIGRFTNTIIYKTGFPDVVDHWAEDYINSIAEKDWIRGYGDGSFRPNNEMTRAEFVTMINTILDRYTELDNMLENRKEFRDLERNRWYYEQMQEAINYHDYKMVDGKEVWTKIR